jgi:glutaredoxin
MIPFFKMIVFILLLLLLASPAFPQIYKWANKDGNIVFSDTPPSEAETQKVKVLNDRENPAAPSASPWKEKREYRDIEVILYMTEWDPNSLRTRAYLKSLGVNLIEYDVKKNKAKNQEKMRKSGGANGLPVIDVEGIILKGFIPDRIKNAVEKRRNL